MKIMFRCALCGCTELHNNISGCVLYGEVTDYDPELGIAEFELTETAYGEDAYFSCAGCHLVVYIDEVPLQENSE